jgi:hypothetical protein
MRSDEVSDEFAGRLPELAFLDVMARALRLIAQ